MSDAMNLLIFMFVCCLIGSIVMGIILYTQYKETAKRKKQEEIYLKTLYKHTINDDI